MRWLLFLSRLAFICGIFFLLSVSLLVKDWLTESTTVSTIITIGYFMGMIVVPAACLSYLGVLVAKRKLKAYVPLWLIMANLMFFLLFIYFIFYLNDPFYHQK